MIRVAALYRYPVKGLTPEACETLSISADGRVAGDRVLGVRFADTPAADDAWSSKRGMLVLMNTPGLARLNVRLDQEIQRLRIALDDQVLADEPLDPAGRARIAAALADYALGLAENPLSGHPERLPLRLVGDGVAPRFHDSEAGEVTLHGRGSLAALADALGDAEVNERRFRSNIALEGLEPWEELGWVGKQVRIGTMVLRVSRVKGRCLATHANPITGERDRQILTTLTHAFGQDNPTFAVSLAPATGAGSIALGDAVTVVG